MSKPTPGPWIATQDSYHETWSVEGGGDIVCDLYWLEETTHERHPYEDAEANARLIAAAPDLLEAAKALMDYYDSGGDYGDDAWTQLINRLDAAINKAEGGAK